MKSIFEQVVNWLPPAFSAIFAGWIVLRDRKNDVPESTKDHVQTKIKEHEKEEDKQREERAKKYHAELSLKLSETVEFALDKHEKRMEKENNLKDQLVLKDVRFLSKQFNKMEDKQDEFHDELKKISENCEIHRAKKGKR